MEKAERRVVQKASWSRDVRPRVVERHEQGMRATADRKTERVASVRDRMT